jgi:hypothetical protein
VFDDNSEGCWKSLGRQRPNALRVHFKGTPDWRLNDGFTPTARRATNLSGKKQKLRAQSSMAALRLKTKKDLGFYYRVQLSLTEDFATVAATQNVVPQTDDDDESTEKYHGVLFENLSAGNTYFLRVAAFSFFLGDWTPTTSGTMVLGAPGSPEIATSTGIFEGPYIEVCVRICFLYLFYLFYLFIYLSWD